MDKNMNTCCAEDAEKPQMPTWQMRLIEEYKTLKSRYDKLHRLIVKAEAGTLDFTPACSLDLLKRQAKIMGEYLFVLEVRLEIEHCSL